MLCVQENETQRAAQSPVPSKELFQTLWEEDHKNAHEIITVDFDD